MSNLILNAVNYNRFKFVFSAYVVGYVCFWRVCAGERRYLVQKILYTTYNSVNSSNFHHFKSSSRLPYCTKQTRARARIGLSHLRHSVRCSAVMKRCSQFANMFANQLICVSSNVHTNTHTDTHTRTTGDKNTLYGSQVFVSATTAVHISF